MKSARKLDDAGRAVRYGFTWPVGIIIVASLALYFVPMPGPYPEASVGQFVAGAAFLLYLLVYLPVWSWWDDRRSRQR